MPDSPFCAECLKRGNLRHTYKLAGKSAYRCGTCGVSLPRDAYYEESFLWKSDFARWENKMKMEGDITKLKEQVDKIKKAHNIGSN